MTRYTHRPGPAAHRHGDTARRARQRGRTSARKPEVMDWMRRIVKPTPAQLERALEELSDTARLLARRQLAD